MPVSYSTPKFKFFRRKSDVIAPVLRALAEGRIRWAYRPPALVGDQKHSDEGIWIEGESDVDMSDDNLSDNGNTRVGTATDSDSDNDEDSEDGESVKGGEEATIIPGAVKLGSFTSKFDALMVEENDNGMEGEESGIDEEESDRET
jgi:hypothetical protein